MPCFVLSCMTNYEFEFENMLVMFYIIQKKFLVLVFLILVKSEQMN